MLVTRELPFDAALDVHDLWHVLLVSAKWVAKLAPDFIARCFRQFFHSLTYTGTGSTQNCVHSTTIVNEVLNGFINGIEHAVLVFQLLEQVCADKVPLRVEKTSGNVVDTMRNGAHGRGGNSNRTSRIWPNQRTIGSRCNVNSARFAAALLPSPNDIRKVRCAPELIAWRSCRSRSLASSSSFSCCLR